MVLEILCCCLLPGLLLFYHVPILYVIASLYASVLSILGLVFLIHRRWFRAFLKKGGVTLLTFNIGGSVFGPGGERTWLKHTGHYYGTATRNSDIAQHCRFHISGYLFAFIRPKMSFEFAISTYSFDFEETGGLVVSLDNFTEEDREEAAEFCAEVEQAFGLVATRSEELGALNTDVKSGASEGDRRGAESQPMLFQFHRTVSPDQSIDPTAAPAKDTEG